MFFFAAAVKAKKFAEDIENGTVYDIMAFESSDCAQHKIRRRARGR